MIIDKMIIDYYKLFGEVLRIIGNGEILVHDLKEGTCIVYSDGDYNNCTFDDFRDRINRSKKSGKNVFLEECLIEKSNTKYPDGIIVE